MWQRSDRIIRKGLALVCLVAIIGSSSFAAANQNLMAELPQGQDTVIAVDFGELRDSPLYDQVFDILVNHDSAGYMIRQLQSEYSVDIKNDLDSLVMTSDAPPLSTSMLNQPGDAIDEASTRHSDGALVIIRGDIDPQSLFEKAASKANGGDLDPSSPQLRIDGMEFTRLDAQTVAIAVGTSSYLDRTQQLLESDRSGPGAVYDGAVSQLGGSQGLYLMIKPSIENPDKIRNEMGALATFAAITIDLKDQVQLASLVTLEDNDSATKMVEEVDGMRRDAAGNPMARIFGLAPLLNNMSVQQDTNDLYIRSSMSNDEARLLVRQIGGILSSRQDLRQPLEGRGIESDGSSDEEQSAPEDTDLDDGGVDAPFN